MFKFLKINIIIFVLVGGINGGVGKAQAQAADTSRVVWKKSLSARLSGTQAAFSNWAEGGLNALALSGVVNGTFERISPSWRQRYDVRLTLGVVKQDTLEVRKAEDLIRLTASWQYRGDGFFSLFNPTMSVDLRTQFAPGYNYTKNPFGDGRQPPVKVSDLLAPAIVNQALGLTYQPDDWFRQRLGVGAKETIVMIQRLRVLYGLAPDQAVRFEVGIESRTEFDRKLFENVHLRSRLGLFLAFNKPDLPDMLWENLLEMQVNSWLGTSLEVVALYDRDVSQEVQLKEVFSLGVTIKLL